MNDYEYHAAVVVALFVFGAFFLICVCSMAFGIAEISDALTAIEQAVTP